LDVEMLRSPADDFHPCPFTLAFTQSSSRRGIDTDRSRLGIYRFFGSRHAREFATWHLRKPSMTAKEVTAGIPDSRCLCTSWCAALRLHAVHQNSCSSGAREEAERATTTSSISHKGPTAW